MNDSDDAQIITKESITRGEAVFQEAPGSKYRYKLTHVWGNEKHESDEWYSHVLCFILNNPSSADDLISDPTTTRCMSIARSNGYDGIVIFNLFARVSSNPKDLLKDGDPVGPQNELYLKEALKYKNLVAGWGAIDGSGIVRIKRTQVKNVLGLLNDREVYCLHGKVQVGKNEKLLTTDEMPRHPSWRLGPSIKMESVPANSIGER